MPKTVTASEAKNNLGSLLAELRRDQDAVIVENRGVPTAAIIPFRTYEELQQWQQERRRDQARATLQRLQQELAQQNQDLDPDQAAALARQVVEDTMTELEKSGKVQFEE